MGGFKSGSSGDDPFGDDADDDDEGSESGTGTDRKDGQSAAGVGERETDSPAQNADAGDTVTEHSGVTPGVPWKDVRNSITDGRERTVQLHLQTSTLEKQREETAAIESRLGESVKKADLREAAHLVGLRYVDEVAEVLREFGYDFE